MATSTVALLGGSGFLGRSIVRRLLDEGCAVRVVTRNAGRAPRGVETVVADVVSGGPGAMATAIDGCDKVVNLIGLLFETPSRGATFDRAHVGVATALAGALGAGQRLVHVSAIGADEAATARYARTKGAAERVLEGACVLRPSIVYGPDDGFFNRFAAMTRWSPFLPLVGGGTTRYQPVHVDDVAAVVARALRADARGVFELGGADIRDFRQLMEMTMRVCGRRRALLSLPYSVAALQGGAFEALHALAPGVPPLLTRDQVELLKTDNVVTGRCGFDEFEVDRRGCSDADIGYIAK